MKKNDVRVSSFEGVSRSISIYFQRHVCITLSKTVRLPLRLRAYEDID